MPTGAQENPDAQDWRLEADLMLSEHSPQLSGLLVRLRAPKLAEEVEARLPHDVVITHDDRRLFAYAADEQTLAAARRAIEALLRQEGIEASIWVSRWEDTLDRWHQIDPPLAADRQRVELVVDATAEAPETRTLVASAGRLIRAEFEQTMLAYAGKLDVRCTVVEHRHLLTTQVAFSVTGPKRKLDEFAQGLRAEGWATIRADARLMLAPVVGT